MTRHENRPMMKPLAAPVRVSLKTRYSFWFQVSSSSVSTRRLTARDWVPTLPDMSRIRDWKAATMVSFATTGSKIPTTLETPMARNRSTQSQGMRFFTLRKSVSFRSSWADRPASLA